MKTNTKAIIIAAGMGNRMAELTADKPKCMLKFGDKTLLQRQIDAYAEAGLTDIAVVRGYKKERIDYPGLTYFENPDYRHNNVLNSVFYAEQYIHGDVVIGYSDILFDSSVVSTLLAAEGDITIVVDTDWQGYYVDRRDHPIEEAENVIFDENGHVVEIGKHLCDLNTVTGEFIGMLKLSPKGAEVFNEYFHESARKFHGKPFQHAKTFQVAYITDLVQEMVNHGVTVNCALIEQGWKEIDTIEDYEKAAAFF